MIRKKQRHYVEKTGLIIGVSFLLLFPLYRKMEIYLAKKTYYNRPYWQNECDDFAQEIPRDSLIVFFGNSITKGFDLHTFHNDRMLNFGIVGDFTQGVLRRVPLVTRLKPQKVFLKIGINDIIAQVPLAEMEANYLAIIAALRQGAPQTEIYIQSILPVVDRNSMLTSSDQNNSRVMAFNLFLQHYCATAHLTFINLFPYFADQHNQLKKTYTYDGIHLTNEGYAVWKTQLIPYLK